MDWEFTLLDWIWGLHTPLGDTLMKFFSWLGEFGLIWIVLAAVLLCIPKYRKIGLVAAAALLVDVLLCIILLKPIIARTRPYDINTLVELIVAKPHDYSFPSGHTAAALRWYRQCFLSKTVCGYQPGFWRS